MAGVDRRCGERKFLDEEPDGTRVYGLPCIKPRGHDDKHKDKEGKKWPTSSTT